MPKAKYSTETVNGVKYYCYFFPLGTYNKKGKPEYKHLRAKTQKKMDEKIEALRTLGITDKSSQNLTLVQWFPRYMEAYHGNNKKGTQEYYRNQFKYIEAAIGNIPMKKLTHQQCQALLTDLSKKLSYSTVDGVRKLLQSMLKSAHYNNFISKNPSLELKSEGKEKQERRPLELQERYAFLSECKRSDFGQFAALLYYFGLRRGEALAVRYEDFINGYLHVSRQVTYPDGSNDPVISTLKTKAGVRKIPIPEKAKEYINFDGSGYLFKGNGNEPLTRIMARKRWDKFIKSALGKDTDITMHCIRHNYACLLIEAGVDPLAAKEIMGHEDIQTTLRIYAHYTENLQSKNTSIIQNLV